MANIKIKGRFYVETPLAVNTKIILNEHTTHHIKQVLRAKTKDYIAVFNEKHGEFQAQIITINKNNLEVELTNLIKAPENKNNKTRIHLIYAPLKKDATDFLLEKATELGIDEITQCITQYTNNKPLELDKIKIKMMQATQQCKRLDIPKINPTLKFNEMLIKYSNQNIYWLNEFKLGNPLSVTLQKPPNNNENIPQKTPQAIIYIIGAEGGFSVQESQQLQNTNNIIPTYFNGNILKTETAAITALMHYQIFLNNF